MPRRRIRITIDILGRRCQVLSIGEGSNGDLNIIPNVGDNSDHPRGVVGNSSLKISIHASPKAEGILIKRNHVYANGDILDHTGFIAAAEGPLFSPVYSQLCKRLDHSKYILKPRSKDLSISLGHYRPSLESLVIHVFVTDVRSPIRISHMPHIFVDFSKFRLIAVPTFIEGESTKSGSTLTLSTSEPRWNRSEIDNGSWKHYAGMNDCHILEYLNFSMRVLSREYIRHFTRLHGKPSNLAERIALSGYHFGSPPIS